MSSDDISSQSGVQYQNIIQLHLARMEAEAEALSQKKIAEEAICALERVEGELSTNLLRTERLERELEESKSLMNEMRGAYETELLNLTRSLTRTALAVDERVREAVEVARSEDPPSRHSILEGSPLNVSARPRAPVPSNPLVECLNSAREEYQASSTSTPIPSRTTTLVVHFPVTPRLRIPFPPSLTLSGVFENVSRLNPLLGDPQKLASLYSLHVVSGEGHYSAALPSKNPLFTLTELGVSPLDVLAVLPQAPSSISPNPSPRPEEESRKYPSAPAWRFT